MALTKGQIVAELNTVRIALNSFRIFVDKFRLEPLTMSLGEFTTIIKKEIKQIDDHINVLEKRM